MNRIGPGEPEAASHRDRLDLLHSGVIMPGMTGPALAELARASCPDLQVVDTSGYTANVIAPRGVVDPGVNFLPKPFTRRQLSEKARRVPGGFGAAGGPTLVTVRRCPGIRRATQAEG